MVKFVYNSACSLFASKDEAIRTADEVFHALLKYVGKHSVPMLISDEDMNQLFIAEKFSIFDFIHSKAVTKKEKLNCSIRNGTFIKKELYNLYSKNISYLPFEEPPFSLSDISRFKKTNFHHNNEPIYKEIKTGYYWYNDYFHRTNKAHFEVFDAQGNHIGEASMQGILNRQKSDKTKTIKHLIN